VGIERAATRGVRQAAVTASRTEGVSMLLRAVQVLLNHCTGHKTEADCETVCDRLCPLAADGRHSVFVRGARKKTKMICWRAVASSASIKVTKKTCCNNNGR
jgi:hypothetical protein